MTSFGLKKDLISTNKRRARRTKLVEYKLFFMTKCRNFHDVLNTTIALQISTSIARRVWSVLAGMIDTMIDDSDHIEESDQENDSYIMMDIELHEDSENDDYVTNVPI